MNSVRASRRTFLLSLLTLAGLLPAHRVWAECSGGQVGGFTQYLAGQLPDIVLTSGVATTKYVIPHYVYYKSTGGHCGVLARSTLPGTTISDTYGCPGSGCPIRPAGEYAAIASAYGGSFTNVSTHRNPDGSNYVKLGFDGSAPPGAEGFLELAFATTDVGESTPPFVFARVPIYVVNGTAPVVAWGRIVSSAATVSGTRLILSHPYLDGRPSAKLFVAHVYNLGNSVPGMAWDHPIAVEYDFTQGRWAIVNADGAAMGVGLTFNYRIDPTATQVCVPPPSTGDEFRFGLGIDDAGANDNRLATIIVTPVGGPGRPVAVKYDGSRWGIVYADRSPMPGGACFNVRVIPFSQYVAGPAGQGTSATLRSAPYVSAPAQSDLSGKHGTDVDLGVGVAISDSGSNNGAAGTRLFWFDWAAGTVALPMVFTTNLTPLGFREPAQPDTAVSSLFATPPCIVAGCIAQRWGLRHDDGTGVPWTQRVNVWAEVESDYPAPRRRPIGSIKVPIKRSR